MSNKARIRLTRLIARLLVLTMLLSLFPLGSVYATEIGNENDMPVVTSSPEQSSTSNDPEPATTTDPEPETTPDQENVNPTDQDSTSSDKTPEQEDANTDDEKNEDEKNEDEEETANEKAETFEVKVTGLPNEAMPYEAVPATLTKQVEGEGEDAKETPQSVKGLYYVLKKNDYGVTTGIKFYSVSGDVTSADNKVKATNVEVSPESVPDTVYFDATQGTAEDGKLVIATDKLVSKVESIEATQFVAYYSTARKAQLGFPANLVEAGGTRTITFFYVDNDLKVTAKKVAVGINKVTITKSDIQITVTPEKLGYTDGSTVTVTAAVSKTNFESLGGEITITASEPLTKTKGNTFKLAGNLYNTAVKATITATVGESEFFTDGASNSISVDIQGKSAISVESKGCLVNGDNIVGEKFAFGNDTDSVNVWFQVVDEAIKERQSATISVNGAAKKTQLLESNGNYYFYTTINKPKTDKEYTVEFSYKDNIGNPLNATVTVNYDVTAPAVSFGYADAKATTQDGEDTVHIYNTRTELTVDVGDATSATYSINGGNVKTVSVEAGSIVDGKFTVTLYSAKNAEKEYVVSVTATDQVGNSLGTISSEKILVDRKAPEYTADDKDDDNVIILKVKDAAIDLTSATNTSAHVAATGTFKDDAEEKDITLSWSDDGVAVVNLDELEMNGKVTLTMTVTDRAGNEKKITAYGYRDTIAPKITVKIKATIRAAVNDGIRFWQNEPGEYLADVTVNDGNNGSGLKSVTYRFGDGAETTVSIEEGQKSCSFKIGEDHKVGQDPAILTVTAVDKESNEAEYSTKKLYALDIVSGEISFAGIDESNPEGNDVYHVSAAQKLQIGIGEQYFDYTINISKTNIDNVTETETLTGTVGKKTAGNGGKFKATDAGSVAEIKLNESNTIYTVTVTGTDFSGNALQEKSITVCYSAAPVVEITGYEKHDGIFYYDSTFSADVTVKSICLTNPKIEVTASNALYDSNNRTKTYKLSKTENPFIYTTTLQFDKNAQYDFVYTALDAAGLEGTTISDSFVVDTKKPQLTVSKFKDPTYSNEPVEVIATVTEHNFDVKASQNIFVVIGKDKEGREVAADPPDWSKNPDNPDEYTCTVTLSPNAIYSYKFVVEDQAGNLSKLSSIDNIYVDDVKPEVTIVRSDPVVDACVNGVLFWNSREKINKPLIYTEQNRSDNLSGVSEVRYYIDGDETGKELKKGGSFKLDPQEAEYTVFYSVMDNAGNIQYYNSDGIEIDTIDGTGTKLVNDITAPGLNIDVDGATPTPEIYVSANDKYYYQGTKISVPVSVTDNYVHGTEIRVNGNLYEATWSDPEGDRAVINSIVEESAEGTYEIALSAVDHSGNEAATVRTVVVDATAPTVEIQINAENLSANTRDGGETVFYKTGAGTATITVTEINFERPEDVAANITVNLKTKGDTASDYGDPVKQEVNWAKGKNEGEWVTTIDLVPNMTNLVSVSGKDYSNNSIDTPVTSKNVVLDNTAPQFTLTNPEVATTGGQNRIYTVKGVSSRYYNVNQKTIKMITVTERNFYEDGLFTLNNQFNSEAVVQNWKHTAPDTWTAEVVLNTANAEYRFTGAMTDDAGNDDVSQDQITDRIVLDTIAPTVSVSGVTSGEYYANAVTGSISVTELNFLDDKGAFNGYNSCTSTGRDIDGGGVSSPTPGASYGWSHSGTSHSTSVSFSNDAIYTFGSVQVTDMAGNTATSGGTYEFTVDQTAPEQLAITYSTEVSKNIVSNILFFDAPVTVTLHAVDFTAGVETMTYRCTLKDGVSDVNAGVGDTTVNVDASASTVTYDFELPASALNENNQFDGYISFSATDRSGNSTSYEGDEPELVVDNIAPDIKIDYDQHQTAKDGKTYFYGNGFTVTITVNEANFDASDIQVLTKTSKSSVFTPVSEQFRDISVDEHVIELPFSQDDEYTIRVLYADHSENEMVGDEANTQVVDGRSYGVYESPLLVLDSKKPQISITKDGKDADRHAYNDDSISVAVEVKDDHIDASNTKEVETTFEMFAANTNDDSTPETMLQGCDWVDAGTLTFESSKDQKTWTANTGNLETDAVYRIRVSATDETLNENNRESMEVYFSVNRDGSTFYYDYEGAGTETENFKQYRITNQTPTVNVHEINVETIVMDTAEVSVTRDTSVAKLSQGDEFKVEHKSGGDDSWDEYTYIVAPTNFEKEGSYGVEVVSQTEAEMGTGSENRSAAGENGVARFIEDTTEPFVTISGIVADSTITQNEQELTITLSDNYAVDPETVTILTYDRNYITGKRSDEPSATITYDVLKDCFQPDGTILWTLGSGKHDVEVVLNDLAGNAGFVQVENVTISDNIFERNATLFLVLGILALALLGVGIGVVVSRKKKNA